MMITGYHHLKGGRIVMILTLMLMVVGWQGDMACCFSFTLPLSASNPRRQFCWGTKLLQQQQQQQRISPSSSSCSVTANDNGSPNYTRLASSMSTIVSGTMNDNYDDDEDVENEESSLEDLNEELFLEDLDDNDDFTDYKMLLTKKEQWMKELQHLAHVSSKDPKAVTKAQAIFDDMFQAYVVTEETSMWPSVNVYNLLIETHAYSRDDDTHKDGAKQAEKLLSRMEDETVEFIARPNLETYMNVMDAWAIRKQPEKAKQVLERLEQRYQEERHDDDDDESSTTSRVVKPTVDLYNKLIKAYGIAGDTKAAENIFRNLLNKKDDVDDDLKANHKSWVQIMKAYVNMPDGAEKVKSLFQEMLREYRITGRKEFKPKTEAYNILIRALGQQQKQPSDASSSSSMVDEAEPVLFEMIQRYREGDVDARPNGETFRNVLLAQRKKRSNNKNNPMSAAKVEQLLQIQEGLYSTTHFEDLKLDARLYNIALGVIARSRDANKARRARRIVDKMKQQQQQQESNDSNNPDNAPLIRTYYQLLSACAFTHGTPQENFEAFGIAVDALKELRETLKCEPDSACFGMFLKACANLMPESQKRDAVVENVFRKCCSDGLVNNFVLAEFERASSKALQLKVLGGFLEDQVRLPNEWSRNVVETAKNE